MRKRLLALTEIITTYPLDRPILRWLVITGFIDISKEADLLKNVCLCFWLF